MVRVHVICEGQTEETFVKELLLLHFAPRGIYLMPALIGKPGHKGGRVNFDRLLTDVRIRLHSDREAYCTTMYDFYGLPTEFPSKRVLNLVPGYEKPLHGVLAALEVGLTSMRAACPLFAGWLSQLELLP